MSKQIKLEPKETKARELFIPIPDSGINELKEHGSLLIAIPIIDTNEGVKAIVKNKQYFFSPTIAKNHIGVTGETEEGQKIYLSFPLPFAYLEQVNIVYNKESGSSLAVKVTNLILKTSEEGEAYIEYYFDVLKGKEVKLKGN